MRIDAHQHLWDPQRACYNWLAAEDPSIQRTIGTTEVLPAMAEQHIDATVLVQSADNDQDTQLMLEAAAIRPDVAAIVAYVPLDQPAETAARIERFRDEPLVVGVRNLIHNIPDPDWILRPDVGESLHLLAAANLSFDLVSVRPRHLQHVPTLSERHPGLRIVIDHLSKPRIGTDDHGAWAQQLSRAAANPLVHAKVSGLYSAVGDRGIATAAQIRPYLDHALDVFGADRLMFGSDWPICLPIGGYSQVCTALFPVFNSWDPVDRAAVLGGTAARFYRITQAARS